MQAKEISSTEQPLLQVKNLSIGFYVGKKFHLACEDMSFELKAKQTLCLVGESGSGKSITAQSIFAQKKLAAFEYASGKILYQNKDVLTLSTAQKSKLRGKNIAFIPQEPFEALNPVVKVGKQVAETFCLSYPEKKHQAKERVLAFFKKVGLSDPIHRYDSYPHEMSGGMLQRVLIANALICEPDILVADEPTTALDVTIQAQILDLLKSQQEQTGMAILFITHDFGVVSQIADDVAVMYAGHIVEYGSLETVMKTPKHPYSQALIKSVLHVERESKHASLPFIAGTVPSLQDYPDHCRFYDRCSYKEESCLSYDMQAISISPKHWSRCKKAKTL